MSNSTDKGFDQWRSKFDHFEAPVAEELWEAVAIGIRAPVSERSNRKWLLWWLLLFTTVTIGFSTIYYSGTGTSDTEPLKETQSDLPENSGEMPDFKAERVVDTDREKADKNTQLSPVTDHKSTTRPQTSKARIVEPNRVGLSGLKSLKVFPEADPGLAEIGTEEAAVLGNVSDPQGIGVLPGPKTTGRSPFELQKLGLPTFELTRPPAFNKGEINPIGATKWLTRLNFGFQMNYSTIDPNPDDDIFLKADTHDVDLSADRLGMTLGYDLWFNLNRRFWLKGQVFSHYRRFNIRLDYTGEGETRLTEFKDQFNTLSMGVAVGLIYQTHRNDVFRSSLDLLVSYENALIDEFKDSELLSYPSGLWNVNLGYTFSPTSRRATRWLIRPYVFYGLNRNFGDRAGEVRPYGFGIQFIKHH